MLQWVLLYLQFWKIYSWRILKTMQSVPPPLKPSLWYRYVDDVFALWPHTQQHLLHFKSHLNKQNMSIQFTTEEENNNKLSFLDVEIERENGHFITSIYRKKTHTDRYLNYKSNHYPRILSGIVKCLSSRATSICNSAILSN